MAPRKGPAAARSKRLAIFPAVTDGDSEICVEFGAVSHLHLFGVVFDASAETLDEYAKQLRSIFGS